MIFSAKSRDEWLRTPLPRSFYNRDTKVVAADLLGACLVRTTREALQVGRIVETEAYLGPHDKACHSARGRTARTEPMFGPPGHAYVYLVYGMHHCLNVVTEPEGHACAVLIRAVEPVTGIEGRTDGPGRLCRALSIDRNLNGEDMLGHSLRIIERESGAPPQIVRRPRIGVDYAGAWSRRRLRFFIRNNPFVSAP